jgi:16S rRNA (guanine1516-N2)-methyltransferase
MEQSEKRFVVYYQEEEKREEAQALAEHLGFELLCGSDEPGKEDMVLLCGADGLSLKGDGLSLRGDFRKMLPRLRHNNLTHEIVVKAAKLKDYTGMPRVLDATAGMGEDSLLLAAAGCEVTLYEYNPVIAALLRDTLRRAAEDEELAAVAARMRLCESDSVSALRELAERGKNAQERRQIPDGEDGSDGGKPIPGVDIILLDPMFPGRKKSSLVKKKLQLIQHLEHPCADEAAMLEAAIAVRPRKILVKRPMKGPFLAGRKPSYSLTGKSIRYDCILPANF